MSRPIHTDRTFLYRLEPVIIAGLPSSSARVRVRITNGHGCLAGTETLARVTLKTCPDTAFPSVSATVGTLENVEDVTMLWVKGGGLRVLVKPANGIIDVLFEDLIEGQTDPETFTIQVEVGSAFLEREITVLPAP